MKAEDIAYRKLLLEKIKEMNGKKLGDLSTDEIQEYLALREEMAHEFIEIRKSFEKIWEQVKEFVEPEIKARQRYIERVKNS